MSFKFIAFSKSEVKIGNIALGVYLYIADNGEYITSIFYSCKFYKKL
jgi:hypothetical protein